MKKTKKPARFEADIEPQTGWPRIRFAFANGWTGSLVLRMASNGMDALIASVAACPSGGWGTGRTELGETEASPDEVIAYLAELSNRPKPR